MWPVALLKGKKKSVHLSAEFGVNNILFPCVATSSLSTPSPHPCVEVLTGPQGRMCCVVWRGRCQMRDAAGASQGVLCSFLGRKQTQLLSEGPVLRNGEKTVTPCQEERAEGAAWGSAASRVCALPGGAGPGWACEGWLCDSSWGRRNIQRDLCGKASRGRSLESHLSSSNSTSVSYARPWLSFTAGDGREFLPLPALSLI